MHQTKNNSTALSKSSQESSNNSGGSSNCSSKDNAFPKQNYGRYCHIIKRPDFDGYGFNLHSEKIKPGQYIGKVDANSPAEAAGLLEGDQIIEVNGVSIGVETHKQVVQRIKAISNEVRLLLIDPNTDDAERNMRSFTTISENNTLHTNLNTTATTKLQSTTPNLPPTVPVPQAETLGATNTLADQNDYISSITPINTKSQSKSSENPAADFVENTTNGHHLKHNAAVIDSITATATTTINSSTAATEQPEFTQQQQPQSINSSQNNATNNKIGLNLNLTAAEMRAKLSAKKKFDPKNESVDLKKKFDIIQKL